MSGKRIISKTGGTMLTGPDGIEFFRMVTILQGMKFELRTGGMKLTRGPSCFTHARRNYGIRGNKEKLLAQMEKLVEDARNGLRTEIVA